MGFELSPDYKQVPERLADLKAKHPEATLQPADPLNPYRIEVLDGRTFIVVVTACYRTPDDPRPGIGMAYEPFPGKTPYTKDSELQNAETSSWGRAIVAALASESKSVASAEDVRNRAADHAEPPARTPRKTAQGPATPPEAVRGPSVLDPDIQAILAPLGQITDEVQRKTVKRQFVAEFGEPAKLPEEAWVQAREWVGQRVEWHVEVHAGQGTLDSGVSS